MTNDNDASNGNDTNNDNDDRNNVTTPAASRTTSHGQDNDIAQEDQ